MNALLVKSHLQDKCSGLEIRPMHAIGSSKKWVLAIESEHISRITSNIFKNLQVLAYITLRQKINEAEKIDRNSQLLNFWNKNSLSNCSFDCEIKRPLQQPGHIGNSYS